VEVDSESCAHGALPTGCSIEPSPNDGLTDKIKQWNVVSIAEPIDVPAGSFTTLHLRSNDDEDGETDWWWARGVGKIKEGASDENDGLSDYCLPAAGCDAGPPEELDAGCGI
jgi:hypothetical protein